MYFVKGGQKEQYNSPIVSPTKEGFSTDIFTFDKAMFTNKYFM